MLPPTTVSAPATGGMNNHRFRQYATVLVAVTLTLPFFFFVADRYVFREFQDGDEDRSVKNALDGCYHVYLDVGSNVGIQVRKLYEPRLYPNSGVFKVFDELFGIPGGRRYERICAVGFEPNPAHAARLNTLESAYRACGWPVQFMTQTAVGDKASASVDFFTDEDKEHLEWGGSIVINNTNLRSRKGNVRMIRLSDYVNNIVAKRKLPKIVSGEDFLPPAVLMKMDIEGSEIETLADLLLAGSFRHITKSMVEFHHRLASTPERKALSETLEVGLQTLKTITGGRFDLSDMDDETYGDTNFPLPECP